MLTNPLKSVEHRFRISGADKRELMSVRQRRHFMLQWRHDAASGVLVEPVLPTSVESY